MEEYQERDQDLFYLARRMHDMQKVSTYADKLL
jgi:hypothetical protein